MPTTPITTVLFDFAWTLFANDADRWVGEAALLIDRPVAPGEPARISAEFGRRLRETAADPEHYVRDLDAAVWDRAILAVLQQIDGVGPEFARALHAKHHDGLVPYADTEATLATLKDNGIQIGVVSNIGWDIRQCFVRNGIDKYIDMFVLSYEVGAVKPDERIWRAALDGLAATPEETIMVGDHPSGDGGAVIAGIAALVLPMVSSPSGPRGFDHVITLTCR